MCGKNLSNILKTNCITLSTNVFTNVNEYSCHLICLFRMKKWSTFSTKGYVHFDSINVVFLFRISGNYISLIETSSSICLLSVVAYSFVNIACNYYLTNNIFNIKFCFFVELHTIDVGNSSLIIRRHFEWFDHAVWCWRSDCSMCEKARRPGNEVLIPPTPSSLNKTNQAPKEKKFVIKHETSCALQALSFALLSYFLNENSSFCW